MAVVAPGGGGRDGGDGPPRDSRKRDWSPPTPDEEDDVDEEDFLRKCLTCHKKGFLRKGGCANPGCVQPPVPTKTYLVCFAYFCSNS